MKDLLGILKRLLIGKSRADKIVTGIVLVMASIIALTYSGRVISGVQGYSMKSCPDVTVEKLFEDFGSTEHDWDINHFGKLQTVTLTTTNDDEEQVIVSLLADSGYLMEVQIGDTYMSSTGRAQLISELCKQATKKERDNKLNVSE